MSDNLREIVLGVLVAGAAVSLGWFGRGLLWRRGLRRRQRFFGLPPGSDCLFVLDRDPAAKEPAATRSDVHALLELAPLVRECGARAELTAHDAAPQSFGERTEFCVGGPAANRRTAAHLTSLLPGVAVGASAERGPDQAAFTIGGERHLMERGVTEYVLLARLTAGRGAGTRPVFLFCGQRPVADQAAARYLARSHARLLRKYGTRGDFCLLLRVVNSQAYGPDVVELAADVTRAATSALAAEG